MGDIIIDGCGFSFGIESLGKASSKGFLVTVSGDAVDSGDLTLDMLEMHVLKGGKFHVTKYGFTKVAKKDGGFAYQVSFKGVNIHERLPKSGLLSSFSPKASRQNSEEAEMDRIAKEVMFRFTGKYTKKENSEALIGVFPYENILVGGATQWVDVTSDKNHYKKVFGIK